MQLPYLHVVIFVNKHLCMGLLQALFANKEMKPKERTEALCQMVLDGTVPVSDLMAFAIATKPPVRATCIESLEFGTRQGLTIQEDVLQWILSCLGQKEPRVKWESAKVTGNTIAAYPHLIANAVAALLPNTSHEGTVVRWSAAWALGEIVKLNTGINQELCPALANIMAQEEKGSISKIYAAAFKKIGYKPA